MCRIQILHFILVCVCVSFQCKILSPKHFNYSLLTITKRKSKYLIRFLIRGNGRNAYVLSKWSCINVNAQASTVSVDKTIMTAILIWTASDLKRIRNLRSNPENFLKALWTQCDPLADNHDLCMTSWKSLAETKRTAQLLVPWNITSLN